MRKLLVTGGLGFIGSAVVEHALRAGREVVIADLDPAEEEAAERADRMGRLDGCEVHLGDVRDRRWVDRLYRREGVAATVHLAAFSRARESVASPRLTAEVNELGTVTVLDAARRWGAYTFVLGSSSSVYGHDAPRPFAEDAMGSGPDSPYGASKRAAELHAHAAYRVHGLKVSVLRLFSVFGPGQRQDMAVARWIRCAREGRPAPRYGEDDTGRDLVHVDDVVAAIDAAVSRAADWLVVNVAGGRAVPPVELAGAIATAVGRPIDLEPQPAQPGDAPLGPADVTRAHVQLGWTPAGDLESWLRSVAGAAPT
jgi:UDP-glucuronate 4-epimerase